MDQKTFAMFLRTNQKVSSCNGNVTQNTIFVFSEPGVWLMTHLWIRNSPM